MALLLWDNAPPEPRSRRANHATLLFSWWCTIFAVVIILTRLGGRKIRTGRLFREDLVMALSLIPLLARMGLVHVMLLYGTNNVQIEGLSDIHIQQRALGSKLVLASRISYAMFIWVSKFTVSEFLKRLTSNIWRRSYEICLHVIRIFLVVTFIGVVIATLSECQPFDHYWQVVPDPGPQCRQGYAQLITMGTADIITDVLLVVFPIPIVLRSHMPLKRKLGTLFLFSFSVVLIVITAMRMPHVIEHLGRQQYRTVWASAEILASAAVSNAVILGSFVRDRGVKRNKYRRENTIDSIEQASTRRATIASYHRDSDEDLFRSIGCRMPSELNGPDSTPIPRPPTAVSPPFTRRSHAVSSPSRLTSDQSPSPHDSADTLRKPPTPPSLIPTPATAFWDVGGLLGGGGDETSHHPSRDTRQNSNGTITYDFAFQEASLRQNTRRDSEIGSPLSPVVSRTRSLYRHVSGTSGRRRSSRSRPRSSRSQAGLGREEEEEDGAMDLQDAGGLLR